MWFWKNFPTWVCEFDILFFECNEFIHICQRRAVVLGKASREKLKKSNSGRPFSETSLFLEVGSGMHRFFHFRSTFSVVIFVRLCSVIGQAPAHWLWLTFDTMWTLPKELSGDIKEAQKKTVLFCFCIDYWVFWVNCINGNVEIQLLLCTCWEEERQGQKQSVKLF